MEHDHLCAYVDTQRDDTDRVYVISEHYDTKASSLGKISLNSNIVEGVFAASTHRHRQTMHCETDCGGCEICPQDAK